MYCEIDPNGYFLCDAPDSEGTESNVAPHIAADGSKPDGMRKPRYVAGSWVDEEAVALAAELVAQQTRPIELAIDALILSKVKARGYNSVESCVSYAASGNAQWAAEANAAIAYRDGVWAYVIVELSKVTTGTRTLPTPAEAVIEVEATVGDLVWPIA